MDDDYLGMEDEDENIEEETESQNESYIDIKRSATLFLLKVHKENRVTQTALNTVVHGVNELWKCAVQNIKVCSHIQYTQIL